MILKFHVSRDWIIFDLLKNWEFCLQNCQFFKFIYFLFLKQVRYVEK